jgi:hypothetical protein
MPELSVENAIPVTCLWNPLLMQDLKQEFITFCLRLGVLRFGEFTLKSGRLSPYFFNAGLFSTGAAGGRRVRGHAARIAVMGSSANGLRQCLLLAESGRSTTHDYLCPILRGKQPIP